MTDSADARWPARATGRVDRPLSRHELDEFSRRVAHTHRLADELRAHRGQSTEEGTLLEQLLTAAQHLDVAHEEMRQQTEDLAQARDALEQERHQYAELFDVSVQGHVVTDESGVVRSANRAMAEMLGIPHPFIIGKPLAVFVPEQERRTFRAMLAEVRAGGRQREWSLHLQPRAGKLLDLVVSVLPNHEEDGTLTSLRWLLRDAEVSRREAVDERESAAMLRAALDALSAEIAILDARGHIAAVNRAWRLATPSVLLFRDVPAVDENLLGALEQAAADGSAAAGELARRLSALLEGVGGAVNVELSEEEGDLTRRVRAHASRCSITGPPRILLSLEDVTAERRLLEERVARVAAESANRAKSDFLATLSHELRTPLNAIAGYAELMEMGIRGPITAEQTEDLRRILRSERHLLALINELLNFARLERGEIAVVEERVDVAATLDELLEMIAPQLAAKGLRYERDTTVPRVVALADHEKVRQILLNLLGNAVKFTGAGGTIRAECQEDGERVIVRVRDNGRGIAPDKLDSIFEPFVQIGRGLTGGAEGVGLGLAISRDLARRMGGALWAESAGPGAGATFMLVLPAADPLRDVR